MAKQASSVSLASHGNSTLPSRPNEGGERLGPTRERLMHAIVVGEDAVARVITEVEAAGGAVEQVSTTRMLDGDVVELLYRRGALTHEQYQCGLDFARHYRLSGLAASGVVDPSQERVDGGAHKNVSEVALHHLGKWQAMVRGVGQVHSDVLCSCVLLGETLTAFGLRKGYSATAKLAQAKAQARLEAALEQLVLVVMGPAPRARMRGHVGERPAILPPREEGA